MDLQRARDDVAYFAEVLIGEPLWPHQLRLAESSARIRVACCGRQSGKSRTLAVSALHTAFSAPERHVMLVSAGEDAAQALLAECARLAESPLLAGSKVDDTKSQLTLSNGSWIRSVPGSEKRVRGASVDLLILDEGCFIDEAIWKAAKWTILARPGSRVISCSTPYGRLDGWFASLFRAGERGVADHESFHWPSTASPMVDDALLAIWSEECSRREFRAEVLAEWTGDEGSFFPADLVDAAVGDYELVPPAEAQGLEAIGGVDFGKRRDASALVVLATRPDGISWVPWLVERFRTPYAQFADVVVDAARGFSFSRIRAELSGVGDGAVELLEAALRKAKVRAQVEGFWSSARSKEQAFGQVLLMLEQGRLLLPRHPELLKQLLACTFEVSEAGNTQISVPERLGHDDLLMALSFCAGVDAATRRRAAEWKQALKHGPVGIGKQSIHGGMGQNVGTADRQTNPTGGGPLCRGKGGGPCGQTIHSGPCDRPGAGRPYDGPPGPSVIRRER